MEKITDLKQMHDWVCAARLSGKTVGVVPTMGALHEGHLSLVDAARANCDAVVTTIFVNPTQFAPTEDLSQYPRPLELDLEQLNARSVDVAFCPSDGDVYPKGFSTYVEPPAIALPFEGAFRKSHFRGVATIVLKLFQMVPADKAFFGQKDYQQTLVIKKMVEDLNLPVEIVVCPIVREPDGLAMSSRNLYLSEEERSRATALYRGLDQVCSEIEAGASIHDAVTSGRNIISSNVDELEYLNVVDAHTLLDVDKEPQQSGSSNLIALVAARVGTTRLIDNLLINKITDQ